MPDSVGVLVLLNKDIDILTPEVVVHRLAMLLNRKRDNQPARSPIAFSWLIFESHFLESGPATGTLPLVILRGAKAPSYPWFDDLLTYLQVAWASFSGHALLEFAEPTPASLRSKSSNARPDPKPGDKIRRQELWELRYRNHPYLRSLDDREVLRRGKAAIDALAPRLLKGAQPTSPDEWERLMVPWSDFLCEARHRGLDLRNLRDA